MGDVVGHRPCFVDTQTLCDRPVPHDPVGVLGGCECVAPVSDSVVVVCAQNGQWCAAGWCFPVLPHEQSHGQSDHEAVRGRDEPGEDVGAHVAITRHDLQVCRRPSSDSSQAVIAAVARS